MARFLAVLVLVNFNVFGVLDRIQKALEKPDFVKAKELIEKGYEKEPDNPGIFFYHAKLLFTKYYNGFNADSARLMISKSIKLFESTEEELIEEILEEGIDQEQLESLSNEIRDYLYDQTLLKLSLETIAIFRSNYPESIYDDRLIYKRDSIAFKKATVANTQSGYLNFINNYTASIFSSKADSLLDELRYQDLNRNGNLDDYLAFRSDYPTTNRLTEVEEYILKYSTASHQPEAFKAFVQSSKTEKWRRRASDIYYSISNQEGSIFYPNQDSLRLAIKLSKEKTFPVMDREKFGFHNQEGLLLIPYIYDKIQSNVKCALTADDWVYVESESRGKILLKDGTVLLENVEDYSSVSASLALITQTGKTFLYHKSGFRIIDEPVQSAETLDNHWIKVKINDKWGLSTLLGLSIADFRYDDIYNLGSFWVFERDGLLGVYTKENILAELEENGLDIEFKFDDVELVNDELLIGFKEDRECLLNTDLSFLIPWGEYEIHPDPTGWYIKSEDGYYLYKNTDERISSEKYPFLESNEQWLALKTESDWMLISKENPSELLAGFDSIKLISPAALLFKEGQKTLTFPSGIAINLDDHEVSSFPDRSDFLLIRKNEALGLYDNEGSLVFDGKYTNLSFVNDSLLRVEVKNKQGIINKEGDFILNPIFETLNMKDDLILTLYKGKIGCYDLSNRVLIPPTFDSRITRIGNAYLVKKDRYYGLIDANKEELLDFKYDEIVHWNDTSLLVIEEGIQSIINQAGENVFEDIDQLEMIVENEGNSIYKFVKEGKFGLISNRNGIILKAEYSEILNIGEEGDPLFFADQHLSNAGFHVVSYVNKEGQLVFSKAYNKREFDRIICDD